MGKLGKETKTLLIAITAVCLISFLLAGGIATLLAKNFQQELLLHDYGVAGHLLNNEKELSISAFTSQPNENDIERGRAALASIGYDETTSMRFLPAVQIYRNQTMFSVFLLLVFLFGAIYLSLFLYLRRQHKAFSNAENTIRQFLDGNTHPASNVHRLVTGTAFFMPSMKWRRSSLLMPRTSGRPKNFCRTLFRMYHIRLKHRCLP